MASAQSRSGTRGRPPPKRCVFTCTGNSGCNTSHNSSEMRNPVVVRLFGVRSRFLLSCLFIPPILPHFRVIRIGTNREDGRSLLADGSKGRPVENGAWLFADCTVYGPYLTTNLGKGKYRAIYKVKVDGI